MKILTVLMATTSVFLYACDPSAKERDCGVFDHPQLSTWQADQTAGTVQFSSDDGSINTFDRSAMVLNEPFVGSNSAQSSDEVTCFLTATSKLVAQDGELAINSQYLQIEQFDLDPADERLELQASIESPVGTRLTGGFDAGLGGPNDQNTTSPSNNVEFIGDVTIGGVAYENVMHIDAFGGIVEPISVAPAATRISRLTYAHEFGLVSFVDANGKLFVRMP